MPACWSRLLTRFTIAFAFFFGLLCVPRIVILASEQHQASPSPCDTLLICPGEELLYEVSWLKVKLGQIRLKVLAPTTAADGAVRYNCVAYVDSYEGIPFVDLHAVTYTEMDAHFASTGYHSVEKKGDDRWLAEK